MEEYINIKCPHCDSYILIYKNEINCGIFRHGIYKNTGMQINPHAEKTECDNLYNNNLIYGCGKPFRINKSNDIHNVEICDYI